MTDHTAAKQMTHQPRTLAVTGGKGGIGKTSISLNLALTLAREGHRVLLLDGDTDLANVSIMLGRYPQRTLANVMAGECNLEDALMEVQHGLHIIPGASGVQRCMEMDSEDSLPVLRALAARLFGAAPLEPPARRIEDARGLRVVRAASRRDEVQLALGHA